jgi:hypothetical protein
VLNPHKYNIHRYSFVASGGFVVLFGLIRLALRDDETAKIFLIGLQAAAISTFALGLLTKFTPKQNPQEDKDSAHDKAYALLDELSHHTRAASLLNETTTGKVRITDLIATLDTHERNRYKILLDDLYQLAPACVLPQHFGGKTAPLIDWHEYDLCIIAAEENVAFALELIRELMRERPNWRIYLEGKIGVPQDRAIRHVFFGASRKCLALLSAHMISDLGRMKEELNQAMQRGEKEKEDPNCRNYLIPIPLDKNGLAFMRNDFFLMKYAVYMETGRSQRKLLEDIVSTLLDKPIDASKKIIPLGITGSDEYIVSEGESFAIALSFASQQLPRVVAVAKELEKRLPGEKLFDYRQYEHQIGANLDLHLQSIYRDKSHLIVVFHSAEYANNQWCQVEYRVVRELRKQKKSHKSMLLSLDRTKPEELLDIDGIIDCELRSSEEIAELIVKRLMQIRGPGH